MKPEPSPIALSGACATSTGSRCTPPVREVLANAVALADLRRDVVAVALVGSWARGCARSDSDVDLVVLTRRPEQVLADESWFAAFGSDVRLVGARDFGVLQERRLKRRDGLEIELCVGSPRWAATDPVDPGTAAVVRGGMCALVDDEGLLARLALAGVSSTLA